MILGLLIDPVLRVSLTRAVPFEEDVFLEEEIVQSAIRTGFPRLVVHDGLTRRSAERLLEGAPLGVLGLSDEQLAVWDAQRRGADVLRSREDFATDRLRAILMSERPHATWVDRTLAELSRAAGAPLPPPLRGFARRVMEYPGGYHHLHLFELSTGFSRGALKARFRRRGLDSPAAYLRWFRAMAAAHVLREEEVTTLQAAHRLGYSSDGNFCRSLTGTTTLTPTALRTERGRKELLLRFTSKYLDRKALAGWGELDPLFLPRRTA